jgi:hypothetical protein
MALNRDRLKKLADGGGVAPSIWSYKTDDAAGTVDAAAYFADAGDVLKLGDWILRNTVTNIDTSSEAFSTGGIHVVNSRSLSAGTYTVDVTNAVAFGAIDSD